MKLSKQQTQFAAAAFVFIALVFLGASLYIQNVRSDFMSLAQLKLAEQETKLVTLAQITDNDGADGVVSKIVQDCSLENRTRFDELLGKLSQLRGAELQESKQLFNACANFYAARKAAMVARLQREYEVYLDYIDLLETVHVPQPSEKNHTQQWSELVNFEKERSLNASEVVSIQGQLIDSLLAGSLITSEEIQNLIKDAQDKKDLLIYYNTKIDTLRQGIIGV